MATAAYSIKGNLVFEHGLSAAGLTVRLYNVGFAGQDAKLGETKTDGQGNYSFFFELPQGQTPNLQLRVLDSKNNEVTISNTKFNAQNQEVLNLVVPATVQPLTPEYQRLAADMERFGGIAKLAQAREDTNRQDLTLVNQATKWDARLLALFAIAAQHMATTGLGHDVLYGLFRVGLPTDPSQLAMVPSTVVQATLTKANEAGIVGMNDQQITAATAAFGNFATKTRLALTAPGAVSSFANLLTASVPDPGQQAVFANLYFSQPSARAALWQQAAALNIPAKTLDALKLQGKFLYLTFNNGPLAQRLQQEIGSVNNLSQLADKDYYDGAAWKTALTALAGSGDGTDLQKLIPAAYGGQNAADRLEAYAADLARKVRFSFPTQVVARMIEKKELPVDQASAPKVTAFLRAAAPLGYQLGQTPLNAFLKSSAATLPALDPAATQNLKTLHCLCQATPSTESLQAAMKLGFSSAHDIASYTKDEFMNRFSHAFPSLGEASLVYAKAQQISSVTFNSFCMAKQLDTAPPVYGLSASAGDRQSARNAIIQQFPTMQGLFGSLDFCQCEHCRSVLSPAAYMVELLEFLRQSTANKDGYTPLDVLIGKDQKVPGRRPDLGALPLTCENTNTSLPYIDLVNEILEYYIAHSGLDANAASDTGNATTADLTAEPQHILPQVYNINLKNAVFPRNLPFDLWIETVRSFFNYFKTPLWQVLDVLRPADNLELFTDVNSYPYYRAQIFAESLHLSPAEYGVLTVIDLATQKPSVQNWYQLYGYADENTSLNGQLDPTDLSQYLIPPLRSAKNLSQRLGLTYQELTDLVTTGFLNPALSALIFQFQRFSISVEDVFSYTGQAGYTALSGQAKTDFEALLDGITQQYKTQNPSSTFNARTWLTNILPANYSQKVLVLHDPNTGGNFTATTLQYADGSAAKPLDFLKLNLFVRLWKKLGWTLDETDRALQLFFPSSLPNWTDPSFATAFSAAWKTALVYLAHLNDLATQVNPVLGRAGLLPLWTNLPTQGLKPLYAQLFLAPSVLNNDALFDDPAGQFPFSTSDPLSKHQAAVQGVLGLAADDVVAIIADAAASITTVAAVVNGQNVKLPSFSLVNLSICYRYSLLAQCLQVSIADLIALKAMSGLNPFQTLGPTALSAMADDLLFNQTIAFVRQVSKVQASGFTVEDLKYLLRHQFDPVGKYQSDPNDSMALVQAVANGLQQIQAQNAVPVALSNVSEGLIEQELSGLLPAPILKALFTLLTNEQTYQASQGSVAPGSQIDPAPFTQETTLGFNYDPTTQTQALTYKGVLLDWKKAELLQINNSSLFAGLLNDVQQQAQSSLNQRAGDFLGVWASLVEYEAVQSGVATGLTEPAAAKLTQDDPAVSLNYNQADQLQWLAYRGVLTDAKKAALTALNPSPVLLNLLNNVQQQAMPAYRELIGTLLAMWANVQSYKAIQGGVAPGGQIDPTVFAASPEIQLSYDSTGQIQTLAYQGVLTDANRIHLASLIPTSTVLANLLQAVRNQAVQFFQAQASLLLTVTATDLDTFSLPLLGIDTAKKQKQVKEKLVKVFLPLAAQKLARQFILQTLSANFGSAPSLTGALLTDAALLSDPNNPGKSLLQSFLAIGQEGVSASYYASPDGSGSALATGTAASIDTADPTNPNANKSGTGSAHFEGYLQVPTDGPYRFFGEMGNQNAQVKFLLDSPEPTALFQNPILQQKAAKVNDEVSQFVQLKGGVPYHFTVDFNNLGVNGASLLVQGENLPKGRLNQLLLYPQMAVVGLTRARILLSKVLQILQGFGLDEREVSYLTANAAQFNNLRMSALPTQASDDSPAAAVKLFAQFLTLADYADLRKGPAGGSDGLVGVFENVGQTFTEVVASQDSNQDPNSPWRHLADLTHRDPQVVRDVARYFGLIQEQTVGPNRQVTAVGDFGNNEGLRRIWQALQLVQIIGIPVASLTASTVIASTAPSAGSPTPDLIAANLKNAVKSRYTQDTWRPIAQSVFDKLRQKKRDALVAYLVNALGLENSDQLFEFFLVDPGMEPVVQTSRLRLALSSVQTFIQRCLLNLENGNTGHPERNVAPGAIRADWWEWMRRYRVWEANRKIFLFPENWMEPELRLDKTDLFQDMESALLQGVVSRDLVEDAFFAYLKGLEVRARLDLVAMYLDQDMTHPGLSTLHVIGRTYGQPHQYFYRTYSNQSWSAWQAVTPTIQGDHVVCVVWRGRLNLFWVTFSKVGKRQDFGSQSFQDIGNKAIAGTLPQPQVQVQLNWCEYFQGKWSNTVATDLNKYEAIDVEDNFDPSAVYIHISKEVDASDNEGALRIHLDFDVSDNFCSFRVASKNCDPDFRGQYWEEPPSTPYNAKQVDATLYTGVAVLQASFESQIAADGTGTTDTEQILHTPNSYALLTCANPVAPPFLDPHEPLYQEAGSLVSPFFFKDTGDANTKSERTFFVQPSLTETTIHRWEGWAIAPQAADRGLVNLVNQVKVVAQVPVSGLVPLNRSDPVYSVYPLQPLQDWATNRRTAISYGNVWIGQGGRINVGKVSAAGGALKVPNGGVGLLTGSFLAGRMPALAQISLGDGQGLRLDQLQTLQRLKGGVAAANALTASKQPAT